MDEPQIAILLSTYERPALLRRSLESIALQAGVEGMIELVVTDDGSTDQTHAIVERFARSVDFRVGFTTHPHTNFRLSRCRNDGVKASRAPYLLFLDGDCILPRDHIRVNLERARQGVAMAGDCVRFDRETTERVTSDVVRSGEFQQWAPRKELWRLRKRAISAAFYRLIRHPTKPKLGGGNLAIWREDYERVNGYDENFQGWGCEDDDLRQRLRAAGVRIESISWWTHTYHLWHPPEPTAPAVWRQGRNVGYMQRRGRLTRCRNGLKKRALDDLAIRVVGAPQASSAATILQGRFSSGASPTPEIEILFVPGEGRFSGRAECNVLVALEPDAVSSPLARQAHLTISSTANEQADDRNSPLKQLERALATA